MRQHMLRGESLIVRSRAQPEMDADELEALEEAMRMNKASCSQRSRVCGAPALYRPTNNDTTCERRLFVVRTSSGGCRKCGLTRR